MDILILDNFDSFTYNLAHGCYAAGVKDVTVVRNDAITCEEIAEAAPQLILISPGPGRPDEAGISKQVINTFSGKIPIFGVCLGMQAIAECNGARVVQGEPMHGKKSEITYDAQHPLFKGLTGKLDVVRYHSLHVELPEDSALKPLAWTTENPAVLMALDATPSETSPFVWGVQFHPESIGSPWGQKLLANTYHTAKGLHVARQA